jgi:hypothetical protein
MLKFPIVERQEINLVFKIKVFVGSKIWYFNKFYLFLFSKNLGCYNGLPVIFFQKFWEKIQAVIMPMFQEFYIETLDMSRLNYGVITLIPKIVEATDIRQFRPITVINVILRIFSKVCASRLAPLMERLTHPGQFAFLKGRFIHDGILALHEIIHEIKVRRLKGVFLTRRLMTVWTGPSSGRLLVGEDSLTG